MSLIGKRHMHAYYLCIAAHLLKVCFFYITRSKTKFIFIITENSYLKCRKQFCKGRTGISKTNNANRSTKQFCSAVSIPDPFFLFHLFKAGADFIGKIQQHA